MESYPQKTGSQSEPLYPAAQGIDVSHHSGDVDWSEVKAQGIAFAFVKATEGMTFVDPKFSANWSGMAGAGILQGAYHYWIVGDDPQAQAKNFIATVPLARGALPPVLDVEKPGNQSPRALAADLKTWLRLIEAHYGVKPLINTDPDFWNSRVQADFSAYPLWLSNTKVKVPTLPEGWRSWTFWQYEQNVALPGVPKGADRNRFKGSLAALHDFLRFSVQEGS